MIYDGQTNKHLRVELSLYARLLTCNTKIDADTWDLQLRYEDSINNKTRKTPRLHRTCWTIISGKASRKTSKLK